MTNCKYVKQPCQHFRWNIRPVSWLYSCIRQALNQPFICYRESPDVQTPPEYNAAYKLAGEVSINNINHNCPSKHVVIPSIFILPVLFYVSLLPSIVFFRLVCVMTYKGSEVIYLTLNNLEEVIDLFRADANPDERRVEEEEEEEQELDFRSWNSLGTQSRTLVSAANIPNEHSE